MFIDVIKLNTFGRVIAVDGLQTGDVVKEGRSCETSEDQNRIATLEAAELEFPALGIVSGSVRQGFTHLGGGSLKVGPWSTLTLGARVPGRLSGDGFLDRLDNLIPGADVRGRIHGRKRRVYRRA